MSKKIILALSVALGLSACQTTPSTDSLDSKLLGTWECSDKQVDTEEGMVTEFTTTVSFSADSTYVTDGQMTMSVIGESADAAEMSYDDTGIWKINSQNQLVEISNGESVFSSDNDSEFSLFMTEMMNAIMPTMLEAINYTAINEVEFIDKNTVNFIDVTPVPEELSELDDGEQTVFNCTRQ